jgi:hypothetical protein
MRVAIAVSCKKRTYGPAQAPEREPIKFLRRSGGPAIWSAPVSTATRPASATPGIPRHRRRMPSAARNQRARPRAGSPSAWHCPGPRCRQLQSCCGAACLAHTLIARTVGSWRHGTTLGRERLTKCGRRIRAWLALKSATIRSSHASRNRAMSPIHKSMAGTLHDGGRWETRGREGVPRFRGRASNSIQRPGHREQQSLRNVEPRRHTNCLYGTADFRSPAELSVRSHDEFSRCYCIAESFISDPSECRAGIRKSNRRVQDGQMMWPLLLVACKLIKARRAPPVPVSKAQRLGLSTMTGRWGRFP